MSWLISTQVRVLLASLSVTEHAQSVPNQTIPAEVLKSHLHEEAGRGEEDDTRFHPSVVP